MVDDLSLYLTEPCRLYVLLAGKARAGVILRRGPSKWWRLSRWDTRTDKIEGGQWFHGQMYSERCDFSSKDAGEPLATFQAQWADLDSEGRLVVSADGSSQVNSLAAKHFWSGTNWPH